MSDTETAPSLADASASATERVDAAMGSTPPETQPETTPDTGAPPETAPTAAPESWKAPDVWEEEFDGQKYRLTPNEVSFVLQQYHKAIRKAQEADGQKIDAQAPAAEAQHRAGEDPRIAKLEQAVQSLLKIHEERDFTERKSAVERQAQDAVEKDPILKGLKSEKLRTRMRNLVLLEHLYTPGLSFSDAAKRVAADYEEERRADKGAYVQGKVEAAKRPVDAAGTASVPQKSMGAKDLKNGNVMKRALERISRMAEA